MQYKPEAVDLLEAIQEFLLKEVMPSAKGDELLSYKSLVSWNMLGVVAREWKQEEELLGKEIARLEKYLGKESQLKTSLAEKREYCQELNKEFANKVRAEKLSVEHKDAWELAKETLKERLSISNPRFSLD